MKIVIFDPAGISPIINLLSAHLLCDNHRWDCLTTGNSLDGGGCCRRKKRYRLAVASSFLQQLNLSCHFALLPRLYHRAQVRFTERRSRSDRGTVNAYLDNATPHPMDSGSVLVQDPALQYFDVGV